MPNIVFWYSKSYFDIQNWAKYRILIFKILFWHSNWGRLSYFNIQNPILTFKIGPNIVFWHSKPYFDIQTGTEYRFWHSKSYFDIQNQAEYRILTFKILFWHSIWGRISYFDIQNPILTFELRPNIVFWHSKSYFDIRTGPNIVFWYSESYFDIRNRAKSYFDIQNPILTFELGPNIVHYRPSICPCRIRVENALKTHVICISFPTLISKIQSKPTFDTRTLNCSATHLPINQSITQV